MRDLETFEGSGRKEKTELQIQKKQQIERELVGKIIPHSGHTVWEINPETEEIEKAMYLERNWDFVTDISDLADNKTEVLYREGFVYVSALNKKNALKKYRQGKNGSKEIDKNPLTIKLF